MRGRIALLKHFVQNTSGLGVVLRSFGVRTRPRVALISARSMFKVHLIIAFMPTNVLGTELKCCCRNPMTGFYRDGYCRTGPEDLGQHTVCVEVTEEFLDFSMLDGNDLVTPRPGWGFPGLKPGDKWCVCVTRWKSALDHNRAAPVDLEATHASALEFVTLEELKEHAIT